MYGADYLRGLRHLCDTYEVHLIADEIAVGCGRTGSFFACEQAAIWPDFMCLSKGISGGYLPLSLVMTRAAIYAAFYDADMRRGFLHSHSYTGNPLACRAALATLQIFEDDQILQRNAVLASRLTAALQPLAQDARIRHFRQTGLIWAADAVLDKTADAGSFARRFFARACAEELLLRPIGNTVYLMPPYILDEEEVALLATRTMRVFDDVMRGS
jgi:adenosylmethionine-8-amino-7-oxononanoate aminotransferase